MVPRPAEVAAKIPRSTGTVTCLGTAAHLAFFIGFGAFAFGGSLLMCGDIGVLFFFTIV